MKITVLTLFPEVFSQVLDSSILGRARRRGLVNFEFINIRSFARDRHQSVDDRPYGGGVGMILKPDVLSRALKSIIQQVKDSHIVLMSASGTPFRQSKAKEFTKLNHLIIICGRYEGIDQRFTDKYVSEELSIGDYVLTGGEIPAMVVIDSVTRLLPGVIEKDEAILDESFTDNLLEYPQYTRPEIFEGEKVPEVLLSGDHRKIEQWRREQALDKTKAIRPDLLRRPSK